MKILWLAVGITAASLTMFSFIPQIIKSKKTKSVKDVSIFTLLQFLSGASLWVLYGIHLKDGIIIIANVIFLVNLLILIWLYFKYTAGQDNA